MCTVFKTIILRFKFVFEYFANFVIILYLNFYYIEADLSKKAFKHLNRKLLLSTFFEQTIKILDFVSLCHGSTYIDRRTIMYSILCITNSGYAKSSPRGVDYLLLVFGCEAITRD